MTHSKRKAFTLIELLVVIAVIVILVAILIPALDAAMTASKFAACGAHQRGIGSGINTYAMNNKQRYPRRYALEMFIAGGRNVGGVYISNPMGALRVSLVGAAPTDPDPDGTPVNDATNDDRPTYDDYMGLDLFEDPLADRANLDHPYTYERGNSVFASLGLWWDIGFEGYGKVATMRDKVKYARDPSSNGSWSANGGAQDMPGTGSWSVPLLAMDHVTFFDGGSTSSTTGTYTSSHNDTRSRLVNVVNPEDPEDANTPPADFTREWNSHWENTGAISRTVAYTYAFDQNYLYTDGAVLALRNISYDIDGMSNSGKISAGTQPVDERMWLAPAYPPGSRDTFTSNGSEAVYNDEYMLLPRQ